MIICKVQVEVSDVTDVNQKYQHAQYCTQIIQRHNQMIQHPLLTYCQLFFNPADNITSTVYKIKFEFLLPSGRPSSTIISDTCTGWVEAGVSSHDGYYHFHFSDTLWSDKLCAPLPWGKWMLIKI